ncbi:MAG TPA: DNA-binding protein [Firmicutes bacterium]|nr:DNA-binding protein [Candidatus Fermentithermobacillaceae bacterium]
MRVRWKLAKFILTVTAVLPVVFLVAGALSRADASPSGNALSGEAVRVKIQDLAGRSSEYNGRKVVFSGEAIGDIMYRGQHAWVNVLDSTGAIGVFMPREFAQKIQHLGDYSHKGDTVEVIGVFSISCPLHNGDPDIHAESLTVLESGKTILHPISRERVILSMVLAMAAGYLGYWAWKAKKLA